MTSSLYLAGWQTINRKNDYQLNYFGKKFNKVYIITAGINSLINKNYKNKNKYYFYINKNSFFRFFIFLKCIITDNTKNKLAIISPYGITAIIPFIICKLFNIKIIVVEWGPIDLIKNKLYLERFFVRIIFNFSKIVWVKEPYMIDRLSFINNQKKINLIPNCVEPIYNYKREDFNIDFLWVNRFADTRTPQIVIKSLQKLEFEKNFKSIFLGDLENKYKKFSSNNIKILNFTEPYKYYISSKFFIVSGKRIFGNNSLLEAMNYGLIPIVNKSQDIDKIIKHGNNGFICENNTKSFYEILKYCIELDEKTYKNISIRAKKTINEKFNNNIWNNKMDILLRKIL